MMKKVKTSLAIFVIGLVTFSNVSAQSDYKLAEQDSLALVAFYWATDGPNWTSNTEGFGIENLSSDWQVFYKGSFNNWFDGPAKDWFGVTVEKKPIENSVDSSYRVTWLWPVVGRRTDGQNQLRGYVPREIGLLTGLEQFRVNGNDGFTNELLPNELFHKTLEHLDTESAWFGGGLPDALTNSTSIRKLNVRYNNYDYMPNLDFLTEEAVRNLDGTQWFYNSRFSYFYMERIVDFFYSISDVTGEFGFEARDMFDVGDEEEIVVPVGTSIEMICNDAGSKEADITYQWFKDGLSKFGKNKKTFEISAIKESDYGHYTTKITNEYVKAYDTNGNYGEVFTKGIHVVSEPVAPDLNKAVVDNSGQFIDLYFTKRMTGATGFTNLTLTADSEEIEVLSGVVRGRLDKQVRLSLAQPILVGSDVTISYAGDAILDKNGGVLSVFDAFQAENRTRVAPSIDSARTTLDGSGILLYFDYYLAPSSLNGSFEVEGLSTYEVASIDLLNGEIDAGISKVLLLTLGEEISDNTEALKVSYVDGSVHGLFAGSVAPVAEIPVRNIVTVDRTEVTLNFEDGSQQLSDVIVKGGWRVAPIQLYDDGSNGDVTAGDHTWTVTTYLADDDYRWDVFSRKTVGTIDTVESVDSLGNTTLTLVPGTEDIDSMLNANYILEFEVGDREITGETQFGIYNRDVVFNVMVSNEGEDIYLMGINDDWNDGVLMTKVSNNNFTYTLPKLTAGNLLNYNYRKGTTFENSTPDTRAYRVKNAENIINDAFGIFTAVEDLVPDDILITPNPSADGRFKIEGLGLYETISVYNSIGGFVKNIDIKNKEELQLNLSSQNSGMYFITLSENTSTRFKTYKILIY